MTITTIGLDGDDTLWHNEPIFAVTEERFHDLLAPWLDHDGDGSGDVSELAAERLLATERRNLTVFGYGVKGFIVSMIETAIEVSEGAVPASSIQHIIDWGKEMLVHPVELLDGVHDAVEALSAEHHLVLVTKGDLFHQESKVAESGLAERFWRVEVVHEKDPDTYQRVLDRNGIRPEEFAMVGNSVRSDVLPVIALGGWGIHVPYHLTWALEQADAPVDSARFRRIDRLSELPALLGELGDQTRFAGLA